MTDFRFGTGPQNESMEGYVEMEHGEELESGKHPNLLKFTRKRMGSARAGWKLRAGAEGPVLLLIR